MTAPGGSNRQRNRARRLRAARKRARELVEEARSANPCAPTADADGAVPPDRAKFDAAPAEALRGMDADQVGLLRRVESQRDQVLSVFYQERERRRKAEMEAARGRSAEEAANAVLRASDGSCGALSQADADMVANLKIELARARALADATARDAATAKAAAADRERGISASLAEARDALEASRAERDEAVRQAVARAMAAEERAAAAEREKSFAEADRLSAESEREEALARVSALERQASELSAAAARSIDPARAEELSAQVIGARDSALKANQALAASRSEAEGLRARLAQVAAALEAERSARASAEARAASSFPVPPGIGFGRPMTVFSGTGLVEISVDRIEFTASGAVEVADARGVRGSAGRWRP